MDWQAGACDVICFVKLCPLLHSGKCLFGLRQQGSEARMFCMLHFSYSLDAEAMPLCQPQFDNL